MNVNYCGSDELHGEANWAPMMREIDDKPPRASALAHSMMFSDVICYNFTATFILLMNCGN